MPNPNDSAIVAMLKKVGLMQDLDDPNQQMIMKSDYDRDQMVKEAQQEAFDRVAAKRAAEQAARAGQETDPMAQLGELARRNAIIKKHVGGGM